MTMDHNGTRMDRTATQHVRTARTAPQRNASVVGLGHRVEHLAEIIHGRTTNTPCDVSYILGIGF
jgi:hypothetical protein